MSAPTLQVTHVTKRYGSGITEVTAVRDVSLSVAPGEIVLIMGPSGSGKTTLLSILGALLKPTQGTIHLNGENISALAENRLPDIRLKESGSSSRISICSRRSRCWKTSLLSQDWQGPGTT